MVHTITLNVVNENMEAIVCIPSVSC